MIDEKGRTENKAGRADKRVSVNADIRSCRKTYLKPFFPLMLMSAFTLALAG